MTRDELEKLLFEGESTYLDWKRDFPGELLGARGSNWDTGRAKLLKDLVALANGHGSERAYLVYGVEEVRADRHVRGVTRSLDDAQIQQWAENTFDIVPTFRYEEIRWDASTIVAVITVIRVPDFPHIVASSLGGVLFEGQVWFRRGSKNTVAMRDDLRRMVSGDAPFKIGKMNDPVLKVVEDHYRAQGRDPSLPLLMNRDSCLSQGYELAVYPGTRREVWVGAVGDRFEHILMLKPKKP
jgi:predicted HTH transcriptional regulator